MPLPLPKLDMRDFDQLVAEGQALIPRHAPAWTDHNAHDPGLTLLELFAWLTEIDIYRLDRVPAAAYRAFLRLLGVELRPALPAEVILEINQEPPGSEPHLPAGVQIATQDGGVAFQTTAALTISPARLVAVQAGQPNAPVERTVENATPGLIYRPLGMHPKPGDAVYLSFDRPLASAATPIGMYVWTSTPEGDRDTRQKLIAEHLDTLEEIAAICPPGVAPDEPDWRLHYSARTVWEYFAGPAGWAPLQDVLDETRALSLSGRVRFTAPPDHTPEAGRYRIRCRLAGGRFECPPEVDRIALNAVPASHAADAPEEVLGISDGRAGQEFSTAFRPILAGSTHLRLTSNGEEGVWQELAYWDRSGPHHQAYMLDPITGEITFGDGRVGRVPLAGQEIRVMYQVGGGPAGNLPAGKLVQPLDNPHNVTQVPGWETLHPTLRVAQPLPALGGSPAETLDDGRGRALEDLAERQRAITLEDYAALARRTPGVPVARARALPNYHPSLPCFPAPGVVTVVVVPECPDPRPVPGEDFLRAVAYYLERRRSLTAEVHVIGPCYQTVEVHARLHTEDARATEALLAQAQIELDAFFHPLTGGPDGAGWPVGRDVYRSEILALLNSLPRVDHVDHLGLSGEGDPEPRCGNLPVCPDGLVATGKHQIQVVTSGSMPADRAKPSKDPCAGYLRSEPAAPSEAI